MSLRNFADGSIIWSRSKVMVSRGVKIFQAAMDPTSRKNPKNFKSKIPKTSGWFDLLNQKNSSVISEFLTCKIGRYPVQRQKFPSRIFDPLSSVFLLIEIAKPAVQKPHWEAKFLEKASMSSSPDLLSAKTFEVKISAFSRISRGTQHDGTLSNLPFCFSNTFQRIWKLHSRKFLLKSRFSQTVTKFNISIRNIARTTRPFFTSSFHFKITFMASQPIFLSWKLYKYWN